VASTKVERYFTRRKLQINVININIYNCPLLIDFTDGRTDRRTHGHSMYTALAQRRAVINVDWWLVDDGKYSRSYSTRKSPPDKRLFFIY